PYVSHRGKGDVDERRYGYTDPRLVPEHIEYVGCVAGAIQKILEHVSFEHVTDASSYLGRLLGVQAAYKVVTVIDKEVATSYEQRRHVAAAVLFHHAHDDIANVLAAVDSFFDDLLLFLRIRGCDEIVIARNIVGNRQQFLDHICVVHMCANGHATVFRLGA